MREAIVEKVRGFICESGMISSGERVLVALSGGADSIAMTHILLTLSGQLGFSICAAHLNHCIRGEEADYDEFFVRSFCSEREIELTVERADVPALAEIGRQGLEECARNVRYDFLFRVAESLGADKIATAHTLSDNAETLIFNLVRGSGLNGLSGISETRGKIIRPLLRLTRNEIEQYLKETSLPFVTDSTNSDTAYTRNYIRKEIIPRLSEINPSFFASVERLTASVKEDNAFLEAEAENLVLNAKKNNGYEIKVLNFAQLPILKRALAKIYRDFTGQSLTSKNLNAFYRFVRDGSGRYQLPGVFAVKYAGFLNMETSAQRILPRRFYIKAQRQTFLPDGRAVMLQEAELARGGKNYIDADKINGDLNIRLKSPIDTLKLPKRPTKSLKKLFSESKIPIPERDRAIVLCDGDGIVWVEKLGVAERCAVTNTTQNIIKVTIKE